MKFLLIFLLSLTSASHSDYHKEKWSLFKENFGKEVPSEEDQFRMKVYFDNYLKIKEHNNKFQKNEVSFKLSMNHLGDMMTHEINSVMNGLKYKKRGKTLMFSPNNEVVPKSIDWREKGAVTPVKNQGHCGSCWAFSSTGALEGHHFIKKGGLVSLSEQNLVDCTRSEPYDNNGCNGGTMESAFEYVKDNHGIDTEESYPYKTKDGKCKFNPKNVGSTDSGYRSIPQGNEDALKAAVGTLGPVSVAIDASRPSFHFYSSGIYNEPLCLSDPEKLDHGVLVVGYGSENGTDFWIVKNSWGEKWGEKGYVRMLRNKNNQCGIASSASYPIV